MLDIKLVNQNPEETKEKLAAKNINPSLVDRVLLAYRKKKELNQEVQTLRAKRNKLSRKGKRTPEAVVVKKRPKVGKTKKV